MIKTAVFVEGQSELIFTRELILKFFEYQNIQIECYTLFDLDNLYPTDFPYSTPEPNFYFQILNIGNDQKVIKTILNREKYLISQGFSRIVGLRDMYSKEYRETVKSPSIDPLINQKFIESHQKTILDKSINPEMIYFHFAIMEMETWLLGIRDLFRRVNPELSNEKIKTHLSLDLNEMDPESCFFHPAEIINRILGLAGDSYDKKKSEVNKFMSYIDKEHVIELLESGKCISFKDYCKSLNITV